jgi:hypothetical protein
VTRTARSPTIALPAILAAAAFCSEGGAYEKRETWHETIAATQLYKMLSRGHHDVKLSKEDLHRITLWLDCNSDFFGSYENVDAQSRGEVVQPALE